MHRRQEEAVAVGECLSRVACTKAVSESLRQADEAQKSKWASEAIGRVVLDIEVCSSMVWVFPCPATSCALRNCSLALSPCLGREMWKALCLRFSQEGFRSACARTQVAASSQSLRACPTGPCRRAECARGWSDRLFQLAVAGCFSWAAAVSPLLHLGSGNVSAALHLQCHAIAAALQLGIYNVMHSQFS